jgi:flavin-binding protein dodecin
LTVRRYRATIGWCASSTLRDLRIAEVTELDVALDEGGAKTYRAKLSVSFKYDGGS